MTFSNPTLTRDDAEEIARLSRAKGSDAASEQYPRFRLIDLAAAEVLFQDRDIIDWSCITELSEEVAAYLFKRFGLEKATDAAAAAAADAAARSGGRADGDFELQAHDCFLSPPRAEKKKCASQRELAAMQNFSAF